jgi:hypothetical protein
MWNGKPDGYSIPGQNPMGMGMSMNFYPQVWVRIRIFTHSLFTDKRVIVLPGLNPTCCHPYQKSLLSGPSHGEGVVHSHRCMMGCAIDFSITETVPWTLSGLATLGLWAFSFYSTFFGLHSFFRTFLDFTSW